jgi:ADP-heptose:LPS heptosyltransferase
MSPARKMLALVEALGALYRPAMKARPIIETERSLLSRFGLDATDRYIVLHTGARLPYTRWHGFGVLAGLLLEHTNLKIIVFSEPGAAASLPRSSRLHVIEGMTSFSEFDAVIAFCTIFIGNDSGPKHLAALRGAMVISLHMARLNWSEWGQEGHGVIISRCTPCAGCAIGSAGEECGKAFACLAYISPQEVLEAALGLLGDHAAARGTA